YQQGSPTARQYQQQNNAAVRYAQPPQRANAAGQASGRALDATQYVSVGGSSRPYELHVPASYDKSKSTPLLLVFHGLHTTGQLMITWTGFNSVADRNNFIVVYGEGINKRWDDGRSATGVDDVSYVEAIIDSLSGHFNIDQRRIYAAGKSNGGYFSTLLGCRCQQH